MRWAPNARPAAGRIVVTVEIAAPGSPAASWVRFDSGALVTASSPSAGCVPPLARACLARSRREKR